MRLLARLLRRVDGATAIEYGMVAAIVSLAALVAIQGIGYQLETTFNVTSSAWAESANN